MRIIAPRKQPATRAIGEGLSETLEAVTYIYAHQGNLYQIHIPAGFIFDGASIPRLLWTTLGLTPHGDMDGPALAHDFIYHHQGKLPDGSYFIRRGDYVGGWQPCTVPIPRSVSDALLEALCKHFKAAGPIRSWLVWAGVRIGGWLSWSRDDETRKEEVLQCVNA